MNAQTIARRWGNEPPAHILRLVAAALLVLEDAPDAAADFMERASEWVAEP